jgi:hypothetical protein
VIIERNSSGGSKRVSELELVSDRVLSSEFSVGDSNGKFVSEEELSCEPKALCVL